MHIEHEYQRIKIFSADNHKILEEEINNFIEYELNQTRKIKNNHYHLDYKNSFSIGELIVLKNKFFIPVKYFETVYEEV